MSACVHFRVELERALASSPGALAPLARHAHARSCAECRAELAREGALEALLARLPAPEAPPALAQRVLECLADERVGAVPPAAHPGHGAQEETELDELLARLPVPRAPVGLAGRVLKRVAPARVPARPGSARRAWLLLAAAVLLGGLTTWAWSMLRPAAPRVDLAQGTDAELEAEEELLAYAVERWELLQDEDLDLWLASLDPVDELLIEFAADETWLDDGTHEAPERVGD